MQNAKLSNSRKKYLFSILDILNLGEPYLFGRARFYT